MKKLIIFLLFAAPFVLNAQMTYVPDDNFEQELIDLGFDTPPLNDSIPTKNIDTVSKLDVHDKNISDLTGIEDFIALTYLNCYDNQLKSLDLSHNSQLIDLFCTKNQLTSINVNNCSKLIYFDCCSNYLQSLDISDCLDLTYLVCCENNLKFLNFEKNLKIMQILCAVNELVILDLSKNTALKKLFCFSNQLTFLNLKNGNNTNMISDGDYVILTKNNPNLTCIQVDDSSWSANNDYWVKDSITHFSENCNYTGVEDDKFENKDVSVAPNPASDFIEINLTDRGVNPSVNESVKIYNFLGEIVSGLDTPPYPLFLEGGKCRIDVSGLAAGVYFVRLGDSVQRFVKY